MDNILNSYIIVVDGNEERVVYDIDDEKIFSVHVVGCSRGSKIAVLNENTFMSLAKSVKNIEYLESCFRYDFKVIKVSDLKTFSEKSYKNLLYDIENFNRNVDFHREIENKEIEDKENQYKKLHIDTIDLIENNIIESVTQIDNIVTIKIRI